MNTRFRSAALLVCATVFLAASASGRQDEEAATEQPAEWELPPLPEPRQAPETTFVLRGGFDYQFSGGEFDRLRLSPGASLRTELSREADLSFHFSYEFASYDWESDSDLGQRTDPWDDIHTLDFAATLRLEPSDEWMIFGGPVVQMSAEDTGDLTESLIYGGYIGAGYRFTPALVLGGGFGAVTQIKDDTRWFPIIVAEWEITDALRVSSSTAAGAAGRTGLELVFDTGGGWEIATGLGYDFNRFRLDDSGPAPRGVGEESSIPIWLRLSYTLNPNATFSFRVGIAADGELELEDRIGRRIRTENYDLAGVVGLSARLRF